jgi:hypothetical protein
MSDVFVVLRPVLMWTLSALRRDVVDGKDCLKSLTCVFMDGAVKMESNVVCKEM